MPDTSVVLGPLRKALGTRPLSETDDSELALSLKAPLRLGSVDVGATARYSARVFNHPTDRDENAVFGTAEDAAVRFDLQHAWVRHRLTTGTSIGAKRKPAQAKGSRELTLCDYRRHEADETAAEALTRGATSFRSLLHLSDVLALAPGEALTMELEGTLRAELSFAWSDALSVTLRSLLGAARLPLAAAVRLRKSAEAEASFTASDVFKVVLSRGASEWRVLLRKGMSNTRGYSVELGAGLDLDAMGMLDSLIDPVIEAIVGCARADVEAQMKGLRLGAPKSSERGRIRRLAQLFGAEAAADPVRVIEERLAALRSELRKRAAEVLRRSLSVSIRSEYARSEESETIVDYVVRNASALREDHADLARLDLASISARIRRGDAERTARKFSDERTVSKRRSSGFALRLGHALVGATSSSLVRETTRTAIGGERMIVISAGRRYEESAIPANDFEWSAELKSVMKGFEARPTTLHFATSLDVELRVERARIGRSDLLRMCDLARAFSMQADDAMFHATLGHKGVLRLRLSFDHDDLSALLPLTTSSDVARAFAIAMPFNARIPELRAFERRVELFEPLWAAWLSGDPAAPRLDHRVSGALRERERKALPGSFAWCSGEGHARLAETFARFQSGVQRLQLATVEPRDPGELRHAFEAVEPMFTQRLTVVAAASVLLDAALRARVEVTRSLAAETTEEVLTV